jgi:hypothetical protein
MEWSGVMSCVSRCEKKMKNEKCGEGDRREENTRIKTEFI